MWKPSTSVGKSFLTIGGIDEDSFESDKRRVLGEEVADGMWINPEPKVFKRDSAGNIRQLLSLETYLDQKMEGKEKADQVEPEYGGELPVVPPITRVGLNRVHRQMVHNICETFKRPPAEWPMFMPFNPMIEVPYDPVSGVTHYTFAPPTGYALREKGAGWEWVNRVVGNNIIEMIAREHGVSTSAVLEALDVNDSR